MSQTKDNLLDATWNWLNGAFFTISQTNSAFERYNNIENWSANSDGSLQRRSFEVHYSNHSVELLFDKNEQWQAVEMRALSEPAIARQIGATINLSPYSWGKVDLVNLFTELLPKPLIKDGQLSLSHTQPDLAEVKSFLSRLRDEFVFHRTIWPVTGLRTERPLDLTGGFEFRLLSQEEKLTLLRMGVIKPFLSTLVPAELTDWFCLCHTRRVAKIRRDDEDWNEKVAKENERDEESAIEDFLASVSIVTGKTALHPGGQSTAPRVHFAAMRGGASSYGVNRAAQFIGTNTDPILDETMSKRLLLIWELLRGGQNSKAKSNDAALRIAIRRIYYASTRIKPEDQLLDLMIAAESIYINDGSSEKSFRLSLNAANWSDCPSGDKFEIFKLFRLAYDKRSAIVHGQSVNSEQIADIVSRIRDKIATAIQKLIQTKIEGRNWPVWDQLLFEA